MFKRPVFSKRNIPLYILGIGLLVFSVTCAFRTAQSDFNVHLHTAGKMTEGLNLYEKPFMDGSQYYYSPFFALALTPFAYAGNYGQYVYNNNNIPILVQKGQWVELFWLFFNIFFLYRIWKIMEKTFDVRLFSNRQYLWLFLFTLAFIARPLEYNFKQVQMTIFLLWASLESMQLIFSERKMAGAALLALAINIKILPVLLLPYLLYRGEFKALGYTIVIGAMLIFSPALFIGWEYNMQLHASWFQLMNPVGKLNISTDHEEFFYGYHGIAALVQSLFTNTNIDIRTHVVDLGYEKAIWIAHSIRLVLVGITFYFLRTWPFKAAHSVRQRFHEVAYILLITPLLFPHQQKYAFFYMLPACFFIVHTLINNKASRFQFITRRKHHAIIVLMVLVFLLTTGTSDLFLGKELNYVTQYLKLITYGGLLAIVPLMMVRHKPT